jgi:hypothetical protein
LNGGWPNSRQVTFNGMDGLVTDKTLDFVKALDIDHARDSEVNRRHSFELAAKHRLIVRAGLLALAGV